MGGMGGRFTPSMCTKMGSGGVFCVDGACGSCECELNMAHTQPVCTTRSCMLAMGANVWGSHIWAMLGWGVCAPQGFPSSFGGVLLVNYPPLLQHAPPFLQLPDVRGADWGWGGKAWTPQGCSTLLKLININPEGPRTTRPPPPMCPVRCKPAQHRESFWVELGGFGGLICMISTSIFQPVRRLRGCVRGNRSLRVFRGSPDTSRRKSRLSEMKIFLDQLKLTPPPRSLEFTFSPELAKNKRNKLKTHVFP